ncbi:MAG: ABC transporter ATP-binding protein [Myxococcota bacterium]
MALLQVENLKKNYRKKKALQGINFKINPGEIFGLIGPNGAGKTTTLRIVSTLLSYEVGIVKLDGFCARENPDKIRELISYLPEDAGVYKNLKGIEYLRFVAGFFAKGNKKEEMVSKGEKIADLGDAIKAKVSSYSKGMTRRLVIARSLMVEPKLAILDEPTSGLDVINSREIRKIIIDSVGEENGILLSSHNMFEVDSLCDRIALVYRGEIIANGSPDKIKSKWQKSSLEEVFVHLVENN